MGISKAVGTTTKKAPPPIKGGDGVNGQASGPWYYVFWPPIRWGVYLTYEILRESFLREGRKERNRLRKLERERKKNDER